MFLYEAVEYLFEELHIQAQLAKNANYYNVIDPNSMIHLNSNKSLLLYNNINNQSSSSYSSSQFNTLNKFNKQQGGSLVLGNGIGAHSTLPHNINTKTNLTFLNKNNNSRNFSISNNDASSIGTRLHNFQNQNRAQSNDIRILDPALAMPLNKIKTPNSRGSRFHAVNNSIRRNLIDLPKLLRKNLATTSPQNNETTGVSTIEAVVVSTNSAAAAAESNNDSKISQAGRSLSAYYRNSKASKLMNSMKVKSSSFRRVLFATQTSRNSQSESIDCDKSTINSSSKTIIKQDLEPKPSLILSLPVSSSPLKTSAVNGSHSSNLNVIESTPTNSSSSASSTTSSSSSSSNTDNSSYHNINSNNSNHTYSPSSTTKILPKKNLSREKLN
jgi:hypothetical protein